MRTIFGIENARRALLRDRGLQLDVVPETIMATIEERFGERLTPSQVVQRIREQVRNNGDHAIREFTLLLDGTAPDILEVPRGDLDSAVDRIESELSTALRTAADRIGAFHRKAMPDEWHHAEEGYGILIRPISRVGIYVPGGSATYPSTVLMSAIPAKVAGVREVIVCTPPAPGSDRPDNAVLAAASIASVDRLFTVGGAQAIAALAYGTDSIPKVDLICGPGNLFVTLAKRQVYGEVGVDGLYGPTETLIIADGEANPLMCAADLLAQAEHDELAIPILLTTSRHLATTVTTEWKSRIRFLERSKIAIASMETRGLIAVLDNLQEAVELSNIFAPEHVSLSVRSPESLLPKINAAGMIFIGERSHEVLGDYVAGPSHVMPTAGTARFNSGLGVHTFIKHVPVVAMNAEKSSELSRIASIIGRAEGLSAHAEAAELRDQLS